MKFNVLNFALINLISFFITFFLIPFFIKVAFYLNIVDKPDGKLKKQEKITPYLGGVSVFFGFIISLLFSNFIGILGFNNKIYCFVLGLLILILLGLIDDIFNIKPIHKLIGQIFVALIFINSGFYINFSFIGIIFCFVWYLTIINAFNLIDVMDGLATNVAIVSSLSFIFLSIYLNNIELVVLLCCLVSPLFAFLYYNKPPAKIYLGDTGSLFLGGFLGVMPFFIINNKYNSINFRLIVATIIILAIPLIELISLIIIRLYKKIPFYLGSPDHFSIYLYNNGWSKKYILYYITIIGCILGFLAYLFVNNLNLVLLILSLFILLFIWISSLNNTFYQKHHN